MPSALSSAWSHEVFWSEAAVSQLEAIHAYVAKTSPEYARRVVDRLTRRSIQIASFPFSGRMVPEYELNEVRETHRRLVSNDLSD
jgi:toxin ParE1/3/4